MQDTTLPVIALRGLTLLPGMAAHVDLSRKKSLLAAEAAMESDHLVFLIGQRDAGVDDPGQDDLCRTGVMARITRLMRLPNTSTRMVVECIGRATLEQLESKGDYLSAETETVIAAELSSVECKAMIQVLQGMLQEYLRGNSKADRALNVLLEPIEGQEKLENMMDIIAADLPITMVARQEFLEQADLDQRYEFLGTLLSDENEIMRIRQEFQQQVKSRIDQNQKEYILREQMKLIHEELGDVDDDEEIDRYEEQTEKLEASEEVKAKLHKEIRRLRSLPAGGQETSVARTYIETLLEMPWDHATEERLDLKETWKILERDHYGLEEIKERIVEYLAVRKLCRESDTRGNAPILCLVGPPGTGKTSIARSVAEAMNKKYIRICLGGVRDEAEIRGHRRTYVGAMPGRIADGIRQAGVKNPLMLLDEIDKVSSDYKGDVSSALLEVLDAEQNSHFRDHYLELPLDLSDTLFIATANSLDTIPRTLLDRMEIIEVSSYTENEKFHIAKKYLVDKQTKLNGLKPAQFSVTDAALRKLIRNYTREAGVRGLERQIGTLCRKTARMILEGTVEKKKIKASELEKFLGKEKYHYEDAAAKPEIGIVRGLAWTSVGGDTLEIEVNVMPGKGELELTGQLGDVMKESALTALTYVRSVSEKAGLDAEYYEHHDLHIHIPEGAVPKDGPSAGITLATAIYSAVTEQKVRADLAMTGEVTLRGRVMPIGGLKEKLLAAKMAHLKTVLVPAENRADVQELSEEITDGLQIIFVEKMEQVLKEAILKEETV